MALVCVSEGSENCPTPRRSAGTAEQPKPPQGVKVCRGSSQPSLGLASQFSGRSAAKPGSGPTWLGKHEHPDDKSRGGHGVGAGAAPGNTADMKYFGSDPRINNGMPEPEARGNAADQQLPPSSPAPAGLFRYADPSLDKCQIRKNPRLRREDRV